MPSGSESSRSSSRSGSRSNGGSSGCSSRADRTSGCAGGRELQRLQVVCGKIKTGYGCGCAVDVPIADTFRQRQRRQRLLDEQQHQPQQQHQFPNNIIVVVISVVERWILHPQHWWISQFIAGSRSSSPYASKRREENESFFLLTVAFQFMVTERYKLERCCRGRLWWMESSSFHLWDCTKKSRASKCFVKRFEASNREIIWACAWLISIPICWNRAWRHHRIASSLRGAVANAHTRSNPTRCNKKSLGTCGGVTKYTRMISIHSWCIVFGTMCRNSYLFFNPVVLANTLHGNLIFFQPGGVCKHTAWAPWQLKNVWLDKVMLVMISFWKPLENHWWGCAINSIFPFIVINEFINSDIPSQRELWCSVPLMWSWSKYLLTWKLLRTKKTTTRNTHCSELQWNSTSSLQ